ncbi:MAG: MetQ/NlpA family ABC transporter substrate-binding protein [Aerococcus suis]|nr:MetQ/NlpA family ABC transporter substrate-binding protein [Aerococcus suis]MDD7759080.1 MetQ/NlpA family ABC transporter substrate-binding protein [Aerococcus suis]
MKVLKYLSIICVAIISLLLVGCQQNDETKSQTYSIGVVGDVSKEIWEGVADQLKGENIDLEIVTFSDYNAPNAALEEQETDLNAYQHVAFLDAYADDKGGTNIVPVAYTIVSPMYIFSVDDIPDIDSIPDGVKVAVSNSPTNAERAYLGLKDIGLIELDDKAGFAPTKGDITKNLKDIHIIEMEPSQIARSLGDADLITVGGDMLTDAGLNPKDAIYVDTDDASNIDPLKKNVIATTKDKVDDPNIQKIINAYQSDENAKRIKEISGGSSIPIWQDNDDPQKDFKNVREKS